MSEFLNKEAILSAADHDYQVLNIPKWGGKVRIRSLTVAERDQWESQALKLHRSNGSERIHLRTMLVAMSVVDDKGELIFGTTELELKALGNSDSIAFEPVFEACMKLSRLTNEAKTEAAKNSDPTLSESSVSA